MLEFHVVHPTPAPTNDIAAHVIIIQRSNDAWITNLATVVDASQLHDSNPRQIAITMHEHVLAENILIATQLAPLCFGAEAIHACQIWFGETPLPHGQLFPGRSG